MIFIDADKENYKNYYEQSIELLNKDGLIIIDNVLWHGEVADGTKNDNFTKNMRNFNTYVHNDSRTEQIIMPIGDGLTVCRKL
jgi:predicted O-methyltransferase YrrM